VCRIPTLDVLQAPHRYPSSRKCLDLCTRPIDNIVNGTILRSSSRAEEEAWHALSTRANLSSMTLDEFQDSLRHDGPPKGLSFGLTALWWDSKGD